MQIISENAKTSILVQLAIAQSLLKALAYTELLLSNFEKQG